MLISWSYLTAHQSILFSMFVSQLKKLIGEHINVQPTIQQLNENFEWETMPVEATDYRKTKTGSWEVIVSWEGLLSHEATREEYEEMQCRYPNFHLEDKVDLEGRNNVRPQ